MGHLKGKKRMYEARTKAETQCVQSFKQGTFFTAIKTYHGKLLHLSLSYDFFVIQIKDIVYLINNAIRK